jgi:hypothetical protein
MTARGPSMIDCVGEPISWLRLETFALGACDPATTAAIDTHLASCPACQQCLTGIRSDLVALPVLAMAEPRSAWRPWRWVVPAFALAGAALVLLVVLRPHGGPEDSGSRDNRIGIKGVGEVIVDVERERDGVTRDDVRTFLPGDRWKVVLTCPPAASASVLIEVSVADGSTIDHPLAPARLACGNRVVVPGAFTVTGARANQVCAHIAADGDGTACLTLRPE